MDNNENPVLRSEVKGLNDQLNQNLCGSEAREWLEAYKTFMKKQPTWTSSDESKNKFLKQIHQDETGIVRKMKMYGPDACLEELFGSLCDHVKQEGVNGILTLIEELKENNLLFSSKKVGVDYIKSGVKSGIHKKGFNYFFAYLDEDGNVFVALVNVDSNGFVDVDEGGDLSNDYYKARASYEPRIVVPAKNLGYSELDS